MGLSYVCWSALAFGASGSSSGSFTVVICVLVLNVVGFSLGLGPLHYVVAGEVFPNRYRSEGVGAAQMTARVTEGLVSVACLPLTESLGQGLVFAGFAALCFLGLFFFWACFRETKQMLLEHTSA